MQYGFDFLGFYKEYSQYYGRVVLYYGSYRIWACGYKVLRWRREHNGMTHAYVRRVTNFIYLVA